MTMNGYRPPLTQAGVEERIVAISDDMETATEELARLSDIAAEAEVNFKVKWAQQILKAKAAGDGKSTVSDREAEATIATESELRARIISEARHSVQQDKLRTMRARLDALRTVSANIRAQT